MNIKTLMKTKMITIRNNVMVSNYSFRLQHK